MATKERMSESDLSAIISAELTTAIGGSGSELSAQRGDLMDAYYGEPFGNEVEGQSQVVTRDVFETIEWALPAILLPFVVGDKLATFEPENPDDEETAKQKTEYVNFVLKKDNPFFINIYTWFKDALLQKQGIQKTWWDDSPEEKRETYTCLTLDQLTSMVEESPGETIEIVEQKEYQAPEDELLVDARAQAEALGLPAEMAGEIVGMMDPTRYDVVLKRKRTKGRLRVEAFPPEEFVISRRARNVDDAKLKGHRRKRSVTDWARMGFDRDQLVSLATAEDAEAEFSDERTKRLGDEEGDSIGGDSTVRDESTRELWVTECYIKVDWDNDGLAELRKVFVAGESKAVILKWDNGKLANDEVDEHPFDVITPIIVPHKMVGMSLADAVMDLQVIRSTVWRQLLDNMYRVNNARAAVSNKVNLSDYVTNRPGGVIRIDSEMGDIAGHLVPVVTQPLVGQVAPLLELLEQQGEARTGISRLNQGLDPDALNKTAKGQASLMGAAAQRTQLIARIFAETGVVPWVLRAQRLLINHQDRPRQIKLRGKWVKMDPRSWNATMDATAEVGLGYDNKDQQAMLMQSMVMAVQAEIAKAQGGLEGPVVTWKHIYASATKATEVAGFNLPERFFMDPDSDEGRASIEAMKQRPDPKMAEVQGKLQAQQAKDAADQQRQAQKDAREDARDRQKMFLEFQLKQMELGMEFNIERSKMMFNASLDVADLKRQAAADRASISANGDVK